MGVFLLEKDKYYKKSQSLPDNAMYVCIIQLDNVDYITYNKVKELMQNKNKKWE